MKMITIFNNNNKINKFYKKQEKEIVIRIHVKVAQKRKFFIGKKWLT
jgi:hypothetical protein